MNSCFFRRFGIREPQTIHSRVHRARAGVLCTVGAAVATILAMPLVANAADPPAAVYRVKIAAQPLDTALQEFASQSGIQIIFFSKLTEGHEAPALSGTFSSEAALGYAVAGVPA